MILFLHFHKCGGSTINSLFSNHKKHEPNINGNPWSKSSSEIVEFWNYTKDEFNDFIGDLRSQEVGFVALEWNFFRFHAEVDLSNIELVVCMRDPYRRYRSNLARSAAERNAAGTFIAASSSKNWSDRTIWWSRAGIDQTFRVNFNKYNYYTKMLNGFGDQPDVEIDETHLDIAKKNLSRFSTVLILENAETFKLLGKYGIHHMEHRNKNDSIVHCDIDVEEFTRLNAYDYELYNYAVRLSSSQLERMALEA